MENYYLRASDIELELARLELELEGAWAAAQVVQLGRRPFTCAHAYTCEQTTCDAEDTPREGGERTNLVARRIAFGLLMV